MEKRKKKKQSPPRMEGVLDWFFRKGAEPRSIFDAFSGAQPPAQPPLPALPAPKSAGLPIVRPGSMPTPARPSIMDIFNPKPARGEMIPAEAGPLMFHFAPPSAPPPEQPQAPEQPILWFPPEPERPLSEIFSPFQEIVPEPEPRYRAGQYSRGIPAWSITNWTLPNTMEVYDVVSRTWDPALIFEKVLSDANTPWWRRQVEESTHYGPATIEIDRVARRDYAFADFATTFGIPERVLDVYFGWVTTESDAREAAQQFMEEVLQPIFDRYEKVLDMMRPSRDLRGYFEFVPDRETGDWWLTYRESKFRPQA